MVHADEIGRQQRLEYIEQYKDIAIKEMKRVGIPASIKMAQAILESNSGLSTLATEANNHFGMKCGSSWQGESYYRKDDDKNDKGEIIPSCFRSYSSPEESFIAHSDFLSDPKKDHRYGFLFSIRMNDYRGWAYGLRKAGYATNKKYPSLLINIIEEYGLQELDHEGEVASKERKKTKNQYKKRSHTKYVNQVRVAVAKNGQNMYDISKANNIRIKYLIEYNDHILNTFEPIPDGTYVYLQKKKSRYYGKRKYHYVAKDETIVDIAQRYGIDTENLYAMNRLPGDVEPRAGEKISLRKKVKLSKRPKTRPAVKKEKTYTSQEETIANNSNRIETKPSISTPIMENKNSSPSPRYTSSTNGDFLDFEIEMKTLRSKGKNNISYPTKVKKEQSPINVQSTSTTKAKLEVKEEPIQVRQIEPEIEVEAPTEKTHAVKLGETLYSISRQYRVTVDELIFWNNLTSNSLQIGQVLKYK